MSEIFLNFPDNRLRNNLTNNILLKSNSLEYHKTLEEYAAKQIYDLKNLSRELNVGKIYVKDESKRFNLNAFKGLGASYAVHKALGLYPNISVFCTATDGNHGRAVAWSATKHNKKSVIYVPKQTTEARIKAIASHGSEVIQLD